MTELTLMRGMPNLEEELNRAPSKIGYKNHTWEEGENLYEGFYIDNEVLRIEYLDFGPFLNVRSGCVRLCFLDTPSFVEIWSKVFYTDEPTTNLEVNYICLLPGDPLVSGKLKELATISNDEILTLGTTHRGEERWFEKSTQL